MSSGLILLIVMALLEKLINSKSEKKKLEKVKDETNLSNKTKDAYSSLERVEAKERERLKKQEAKEDRREHREEPRDYLKEESDRLDKKPSKFESFKNNLNETLAKIEENLENPNKLEELDSQEKMEESLLEQRDRLNRKERELESRERSLRLRETDMEKEYKKEMTKGKRLLETISIEEDLVKGYMISEILDKPKSLRNR